MAKVVPGQGGLSEKTLIKARKLIHFRAYKGRLYASKWPRPRGPGNEQQQAWVEQFSAINRLMAEPIGIEYDNAVELAEGTKWYWRDVLYEATIGNLIRDRTVPLVTTPTARVGRTTYEALTANVTKTLTPIDREWDNYAWWSATVNPTRLTAKYSGLYLLAASVAFRGGTTTYRQSFMRKNATTVFLPVSTQHVSGQDDWMNLFGIDYLNANDYIEVQAFAPVSSVSARLAAFTVVAITPEGVIADTPP